MEKIIGIDIDGIVRNFNGNFIKKYNETLNHFFKDDIIYKQIPYHYEPSTWYFEDDPLFNPKITKYIWVNMSEKILMEAEIYPNTYIKVEEIFATFPNVFFITHQHTDLGIEVTKDWIKKRFNSEKNILFVKGKEKYKYVDILIDDCTANLVEAKKNNKLGIAVARNWNKDWDGYRIDKLTSFKLEEIINEYYKK